MKIYIAQGNTSFALPINPERLQLSEKSNNKTKTVLNLGDVNIPNVRGLNEIKFDSLFPFSWGNYCSVTQAQLKRPMDYVNLIMSFKNSNSPVRLLFAGNIQQIIKANGNTSGLFLIEDMDWEVRAGEEEDIYFSIKFKQYRSYEPRKVTIKKPVQATSPAKNPTPIPNPVVTQKPITRPVPVPKPTYYTVQSGDNLWNIAQQHYGNGNLYTKIATANKIGTPSLIHPGQKLVIP